MEAQKINFRLHFFFIQNAEEGQRTARDYKKKQGRHPIERQGYGSGFGNRIVAEVGSKSVAKVGSKSVAEVSSKSVAEVGSKSVAAVWLIVIILFI